MQEGYDALGSGYAAWNARVEGDPRNRFLADFAARLLAGVRVLDVGCGPGVPSTRELAERFQVVGVDLSEAQLRLARANVPRAAFVHADVSALDLEDSSFAGIVALYSVSHLPRAEHADLFRRLAAWLEPGGLLLATLGAGDLPDWSGEWLGVPMFFSSHGPDENRALLANAGFELLVDEVVEMREPEGPVSFLWVLARKPGVDPQPHLLH